MLSPIWRFINQNGQKYRKFVPLHVCLTVAVPTMIMLYDASAYGIVEFPTMYGLVVRIVVNLPTFFYTFGTIIYLAYRKLRSKKILVHHQHGSIFIRLLAGAIVLCVLFSGIFYVVAGCRIYNTYSHTRCSPGALLWHSLCLLNLLGVGIGVCFNQFIPRRTVFHLFFLAHITAGVIVKTIWILFKEEEHIFKKIFPSSAPTERQSRCTGFDCPFSYLSSLFIICNEDSNVCGYTMYVEYLIVAVVILLAVIWEVGGVGPATKAELVTASSDCQQQMEVFALPRSPVREIGRRRRRQLFSPSLKNVTLGVAMVAGIITFCVVGVHFNIHEKRAIKDPGLRITAYLLLFLNVEVLLGILLPLLLLLDIGGGSLRRDPDHSGTTISTQLDRYFFYFGYSVMFFYAAASLINSLANLSLEPSYVTRVEVAIDVISLAQSFFQAGLILYVDFFRRRQGYWAALCLVVVNLTMFVLNCFGAGELGSDYTLPDADGNENKTWLMVVRGLAPACFFFRFHTAALMMEAAEHCSHQKTSSCSPATPQLPHRK